MAAMNGAVMGIVAQSGDATNKGRVRVRIPTLATEDGLWARVCTPFGNAGTTGRPQVSDEVLVLFEHGDVSRPIVVGKMAR